MPGKPGSNQLILEFFRTPIDVAAYQWLSRDTILSMLSTAAHYGKSGWQAARSNVVTGHVTAFQAQQPDRACFRAKSISEIVTP